MRKLNLYTLWKSERGAFDLLSVMIGAVVSLIIATASVLAVVGIAQLTQRSNAKALVQSTVLAEKSYFGANDMFANKATLVNLNLISDSKNLCATTDATNSTYTIAGRTPDGTSIFYVTSADPNNVQQAAAGNNYCFS